MKRLFWFLKPRAKLNMSNQADLELYVQQVMTRGRISDVRELLKKMGDKKTNQIFLRLKKFLPFDVRLFWEDFFEHSH